MAHALISRMLHEPTVRLQESAGEEDSYRYVNALRELFSLDPALADVSEGTAAEVTPLAPRRRSRSGG